MLITGAAGGIGRAAAVRFAAEGARLGLLSRDGLPVGHAVEAEGRLARHQDGGPAAAGARRRRHREHRLHRGLRGSRNLVAYTASKHAVVGLTRTAALELAPAGIRVNAVCPSPIHTAMVQDLEAGASPANPAAFHERRAGTIPLRRYGQPEEVAALVALQCHASGIRRGGPWCWADAA